MGLLDFLNSDESRLGIGLLAAAGPRSTGTGFGQRLSDAMGYVSEGKQADMRSKLLQSQLDENVVQNRQREMQMQNAMQQQARENAFFGVGGAQPTTQGAGMMPQSAMSSAAPQQAQQGAPTEGKFDEWSRIFGIPKDALVVDYMKNGGKGIAEMLAKRGTPDMQVSNGYAYDKNKLGAGFMPSLSTSQDGKSTMTRIGNDGLPVISSPEGALKTFGDYQDAQAARKPIKVYNEATGREDWSNEGAVTRGRAAPMPNATGNPLIDAIMQTESNGNPNAVSPKGAQGLMQVMPGTNKNPGFGITPAADNSEPERFRVGKEYIGKMQERYGNPTLAAIAYNWGPGNTDMWLKGGGDFSKLPAETRNYVSAVMTRQAVNGLGVQPQAQAQMQPQSGNYAAGPSAQETAVNAANQERLVGTARADVAADTTKKKAVTMANENITNADRAIELLGMGPTASGIGQLMDRAAAFGGQSTSGGNIAAKLDIISAGMVKNVPRFEGPQSDKDVDQYKAAAGRLSDRGVPIEQRIEAAQEIKRLATKAAGQQADGGGSSVSSGGASGSWGGAPVPKVPMRGQVIGGYKFKGGNPSDKSNWEQAQ